MSGRRSETFSNIRRLCPAVRGAASSTKGESVPPPLPITTVRWFRSKPPGTPIKDVFARHRAGYGPDDTRPVARSGAGRQTLGGVDDGHLCYLRQRLRQNIHCQPRRTVVDIRQFRMCRERARTGLCALWLPGTRARCRGGGTDLLLCALRAPGRAPVTGRSRIDKAGEGQRPGTGSPHSNRRRARSSAVAALRTS